MLYNYTATFYDLPAELLAEREPEIAEAIAQVLPACDYLLGERPGGYELAHGVDLTPEHRMGPTLELWAEYQPVHQPHGWPVTKGSPAAQHFEQVLVRLADELYALAGTVDAFRVTGLLDGTIVHWHYDLGGKALKRLELSRMARTLAEADRFSSWLNPSYEDAHL